MSKHIRNTNTNTNTNLKIEYNKFIILKYFNIYNYI